MLETGMRSGELVSMRISDVDLAASRAQVTHAKTYTVKVTATTKYGTSDAAVTKVAVA